MKKLIVLVCFFSAVSVGFGDVSTRVCLADGNTPLEYQDIMVGTKLTIIVDSNVAEYWTGALLIEGDHRDRGKLADREDSCYDAAGVLATVELEENYWPDISKDVRGYNLYTDMFGNGVEPNSWFIIDYNATSIGDCNVGFYEYETQFPFEAELLYYLEFTHVRTRDFDESTRVDFGDFAILASYWQEQGCEDPDWCQGTDLDISGTVDMNDLMLFSDYWLERTE